MADIKEQQAIDSRVSERKKFSVQELATRGYIVPGKPFAVIRNSSTGQAGVTEQYLPITSERFYNVNNSQIVSSAQIFNEEIRVRELNTEELQTFKTLHPEIMSREEFKRVLQKDVGRVQGIKYSEGFITANSFRNDALGAEEKAIPSSIVVEVRERIRKKQESRAAASIVEKTESKRRIAVISKNAVETLRDKLASASDKGNLKSLREFKKSLSFNEAHDFQIVEQLQDRKNKETILNTFNRASSGGKYKSGKNIPSASSLNEIHIVGQDEVLGKTQKILQREAHIASKVRTNGSIVADNKFKLVYENGYKNQQKSMLDPVLSNLDEYTKNKGIGLLLQNPEGTAQHVVFQYAGANWTDIQKGVANRIKSIDAITGTSFNKTTEGRTIHSNVYLNQWDVRRLSGLPETNTIFSGNLYEKKLSELAEINDRLNAIVSGERVVKRDGSVVSGMPTDEIRERLISIYTEKTTTRANRVHNFVAKKTLTRILDAYDPYNPRKTTYNYDRYNGKRKYSRKITHQTGLIGMVSAVMGTYFYQSMLRHAHSKALNLYQDFIQPGEIIEAKKHTSLETTVRRMMTTDFGAKWSNLGMFMKDLVFNGRTASQQFQNLTDRYDLKLLRRLLDPKYTAGQKVNHVVNTARKNIRKLIDHTRSQDSQYIKKMSENIQQMAAVMTEHKGKIIAATGSVLLLSRFGQTEVEKDNETIFRKRYFNIGQEEHLTNNKATEELLYESPTRRTKLGMIGFGSPYIGIKLSKYLLALPRVRAKQIVGIIKKNPDVLAREISQRGGFRFDVVQRWINDSSRHNLARAQRERGGFARGHSVNDITLGHAVNDANRIIRETESTVASAAAAHTNTINRVTGNELRREAANLGKSISERVGLPKPIPAPDFSVVRKKFIRSAPTDHPLQNRQFDRLRASARVSDVEKKVSPESANITRLAERANRQYANSITSVRNERIVTEVTGIMKYQKNGVHFSSQYSGIEAVRTGPGTFKIVEENAEERALKTGFKRLETHLKNLDGSNDSKTLLNLNRNDGSKKARIAPITASPSRDRMFGGADIGSNIGTMNTNMNGLMRGGQSAINSNIDKAEQLNEVLMNTKKRSYARSRDLTSDLRNRGLV